MTSTTRKGAPQHAEYDPPRGNDFTNCPSQLADKIGEWTTSNGWLNGWVISRNQIGFVFAAVGIPITLIALYRAEKHHKEAMAQAAAFRREDREFYQHQLEAGKPRPEVLFWNEGHPTNTLTVRIPDREAWLTNEEIEAELCREREERTNAGINLTAYGGGKHETYMRDLRHYLQVLESWLHANRWENAAWHVPFDIAVVNSGKGSLAGVRVEIGLPVCRMVESESDEQQIIRRTAEHRPQPPEVPEVGTGRIASWAYQHFTANQPRSIGAIGTVSYPAMDMPAIGSNTWIDDDVNVFHFQPGQVVGEDHAKANHYEMMLPPLDEPMLVLSYNLWSEDVGRKAGQLRVTFEFDAVVEEQSQNMTSVAEE
jgi:hypothetical protein